jgi:hypothetical protein
MERFYIAVEALSYLMSSDTLTETASDVAAMNLCNALYDVLAVEPATSEHPGYTPGATIDSLLEIEAYEIWSEIYSEVA